MSDKSSTDTTLKLKLLGPISDAIGNTLQNTWELVFGPLDLYVQRKKLSRQHDFEEFKKEFESKVSEIPENSLKEPKLSILGPTLEASKYYFEEKSLRSMFASLAASSVDERKERYLHPSFPEIIKQMSPLDADNLRLFTSQLPIAEYYKLKKGSTTKTTLLSNVFLWNKDEQDVELQSQSISSLDRLGLLRTEYQQTILGGKFYSDFYTTTYFMNLTIQANKAGFLTGVTRGRAVLTPLGKSFKLACLEP